MAAKLANVKKGDKVILRLFTGAFSGVKEVAKADKDFIYFETRRGMSKFSKKTGKMVDPAPKSEKYASYIEEYDEDVESEEMSKKERTAKPAPKKADKKAPKKAKAAEPEEIEDDEEEEEDDEEEEVEEPAPKKKKVVKKKVAKKHTEEDDEDFEEVE